MADGQLGERLFLIIYDVSQITKYYAHDAALHPSNNACQYKHCTVSMI